MGNVPITSQSKHEVVPSPRFQSSAFSTRVSGHQGSRTFRMQEDAAPAMTPAQYLATMPGQLAPMGFFDPAGFTNDKSISEIKRYREAEVTHGRVAMLAVLGFLVGENFGPLFDGNINGVAINQFWDVPK